MSNQQEKKLFAERLTQALLEDKHPISPTYLSKEFNFRYDGQPISVQSANNWLLGKAIPSQDKLSLLALWLNVSKQWLRFGDQNPVDETSVLTQSQTLEFDYFLKFKGLKSVHKEIIKNLIDEFSQINQS